MMMLGGFRMLASLPQASAQTIYPGHSGSQYEHYDKQLETTLHCQCRTAIERQGNVAMRDALGQPMCAVGEKYHYRGKQVFGENCQRGNSSHDHDQAVAADNAALAIWQTRKRMRSWGLTYQGPQHMDTLRVIHAVA
jgi:hypothetical protein